MSTVQETLKAIVSTEELPDAYPSACRPQSIPDLLKERAAQDGSYIAIGAPGCPPLTYQALWTQVQQTATGLRAIGVGPEDRVAIVLPNGPELAVAFLATASAAACAPLNPVFGSREFRFYLSDLNARALLVQSELDSPARAVAEELGIPTLEISPMREAGAGLFTLDTEMRPSQARDDLAVRDNIALLLHTSGTTARPKMVPLTHANLLASAHNIQMSYELARADRCLNMMPLFHIHGLVAAILSTLVAGGSVVCTPGFDASLFFDWLAEYCPTWYTAVPTMHQAILRRAEVRGHAVAGGSLRFIRSCSAPLPPTVMAEMERLFEVPVLEAYGMTEASHQMTSNPLPPRERKAGSVGIPTGPEVAIMDESGNLLTAEETGEIVIRGANVTSGYANNPQANEDAFVAGWFRTGDQGCLDQEGYLRITGRIKEIINRGGEKVAPREVDEALLEHPDVVQAVAFALPHVTLGEDLAAAVVLGPDASVTEQELRRMVLQRLADFKVPSQIVFVEELPKGPTGKVQRIGLAEILAPMLQEAYVAPRNETEWALARVWASVLDVERIGIHDNFFGLGGDSLLATRVMARVRENFGVVIPLNGLFEAPNIAGQAMLVETTLWAARGIDHDTAAVEWDYEEGEL